MRDDKRKTIKGERLPGWFKRESTVKILKIMRATWPGLSDTQHRRLLSHAYQSMRAKRKGK